MPTLSALIVAHNEQHQLAECLATLGFVDEIVVVLDRCTDDSRAIAARFTDRILEGAWPIEGDRRNAGIAFCTGDWVLEVDGDERVGPELAAEIRAVIAASPHTRHNVPVDNHVGGRLIRYGWGAAFGVGSKAILFRREAKTWGRERVHPNVIFTGSRGPMLTCRLTHYVDRDISDMIRRLDRYTTAHALDLRDAGIPETFGRNVRRMFARFYKCYVRRKGYREGRWGFLLALMAALYPILSYLKAVLEAPEQSPR